MITFELIERPDQHEVLKGWALAPHVRQWWPDVEESLADAMSASRSDDVEAILALLDGRPIAFVQVWRPSSGSEYPWQNSLAVNARGFDMFIGEEKDLGHGLGSQVANKLARKLLTEGATKVFIDPSFDNYRAIRSYTKAGFAPIGIVQDCDGESLLMEYKES